MFYLFFTHPRLNGRHPAIELKSAAAMCTNPCHLTTVQSEMPVKILNIGQLSKLICWNLDRNGSISGRFQFIPSSAVSQVARSPLSTSLDI